MDLSGTLSEPEQNELNAKLRALEQSKGSQFAVLIIPSTGEESIEQYSIRVVEAWQLGRKGIDDGVLLLIAKDDRTVRIEVGTVA
ncbi:TPM domain-containing protein [Chitinibacter sp. FCG-7]|uniref:TPM domain-containing protein n=1 Tax=Chitinibacter mangrovi TaxID=3153927 RepID=A0AAU7F5W6_9NEIS